MAVANLAAGAELPAQAGCPGVCQALGKGSYSLLISLLRFIILTLPLAWLFSALPSSGTFVWLALPIAEAGACLTAVGLMKHVLKKRNI